MVKAAGGYRRKPVVPVQFPLPPVFKVAGAFHRGLGYPFPLRRIGVPVQKAVAKPPDNAVFRYDRPFQRAALLIPAQIGGPVGFKVVRI
jgi:hypothetical protein